MWILGPNQIDQCYFIIRLKNPSPKVWQVFAEKILGHCSIVEPFLRGGPLKYKIALALNTITGDTF